MCCCQDWGGKFHGLILRIACILHCADCCSRGVEPSDESVNHDTLVRSFSIAHYYRYQAIYGFSVNAPDGNIVKTEKIIQIFKTKNIRQDMESDHYHFPADTNFFLTAKGIYTDTTKTKKSQRSLKFPQYVMDMLREYKDEQDAECEKLGSK